MKMFIVDDKEGNLYMLDSLLKGKGYAVASGLKVKLREKAAPSPFGYQLRLDNNIRRETKKVVK